MLDSKSIKFFTLVSIAFLFIVLSLAFLFFRLNLNSIQGNGVVVYRYTHNGDHGVSKLEIHEMPGGFSDLNNWYSKSDYSFVDPIFDTVKYQHAYCAFEFAKLKQYHVGFLMINNQEQIDSLSTEFKDDNLKNILKVGGYYFFKSIFREHLWGGI